MIPEIALLLSMLPLQRLALVLKLLDSLRNNALGSLATNLLLLVNLILLVLEMYSRCSISQFVNNYNLFFKMFLMEL